MFSPLFNWFLIISSGYLIISAGIVSSLSQSPANDELECDDKAEKIFFEALNDCNAYRVCFKNKLLPGKCPEGYFFDFQKQACNYEDVVKCNEPKFKCPNDEGITTHPSDISCSQYTMCKFGEPLVEFCPPGMHYSIEVNACTPMNYAKCVTDNSICATADGEDVYIPNINDCNKFYKCDDNKAIQPLQCANEDEHWDQLLSQCISKQVSTCVPFGSSPAEIQDPEIDVECQHDGYHFMPHRDDCTAYYICYQNRAYLQYCHEKLLFDYHTLKCQLPTAGQCIMEKYMRLD